MPIKKTTLISASFDLNKLDSSGAYYYDATLSGNFASAVSHSKATSPADTLTAKGNNATLYGGAGEDSLVALREQ